MTMDAEKAHYVLRYYGQLMTMPERLAHRHLLGTAKATHGRTDAVAQREAENSLHPAHELLSNDPKVLQLVSDGIEAFVLRTAQRILDEHGNEVAFIFVLVAVRWPRHRKRDSVVSAATTGILPHRQSKDVANSWGVERAQPVAILFANGARRKRSSLELVQAASENEWTI